VHLEKLLPCFAIQMTAVPMHSALQLQTSVTLLLFTSIKVQSGLQPVEDWCRRLEIFVESSYLRVISRLEFQAAPLVSIDNATHLQHFFCHFPSASMTLESC